MPSHFINKPHALIDLCKRCCDALWANRDDDNDRVSVVRAVSYLAAYMAKDSAENHSAGNINGIPPLIEL